MDFQEWKPFKVDKKIVVNRPLYYPRLEDQLEAYRNLTEKYEAQSLEEITRERLELLGVPFEVYEYGTDRRIEGASNRVAIEVYEDTVIRRPLYKPMPGQWSDEQKLALKYIRGGESFEKVTKKRFEKLGVLYKVYKRRDDVWQRKE